MTTATQQNSSKRKARPRMIGVVTSDKVSKTRKVTFEYLSRHAKKYNRVREAADSAARARPKNAGAGSATRSK